MKKTCAILLFIICAGACFTQEAITLDEALHASMRYLTGRLAKGSMVVVLNFEAPTKELSDYVIEELTAYIVNEESLTVVDRRNLEMLQRELNFQLSGEVSEETALSIGQKLGAQTIISGSIVSLGTTYRIRIQAIGVETAAVQGAQTLTVRLDSTLAVLLGVEYQEVPSIISNGRRMGAVFLNLGLGLGSFIMGDWVGGVVIMGGYALAAGLIVWDVVGLSYEDDLAGVPGAIGLGVAGTALVIGLIRPFLFRRNATRGQAVEGLNMSVVPGPAGAGMVQVSYTYRF